MIAVPVGSRWPGSAVGPARQRGSCTLGDGPRAVAADADRRDLVLGRIGGAQHVCRSRAADVVLGRLAAEQHHQLDSIACSHAAPTVPCAAMRFRASDVAAATGGRLVGPDVDIDGAGFDTRTLRARPAVRAAGRRARRPRVHRRRAGAPAPPRTSRRDPQSAGTAIEVDDTLARADGPRRRSPPLVRRHRDRHHRIGRQDQHQGLGVGSAGRQPAHDGERAQLQQRAGPADHDPQHARRHRGDGAGDGHARVR